MRRQDRGKPNERNGAGGKTSALGKLLRESLDSAKLYSRRLKPGLNVIAEQFEAGDAPTALSLLSYALDGLSWLLDVYDRCRFFLAAPIRPDEEAIVQTKLLETLKRLVALAEEGDCDGAAWMVRQELLPRVETLLSRLEELSRLRTEPQ